MQKVLRRIVRRCPAVGFTGRKGSLQVFEKWLPEGIQKAKTRPLCRGPRLAMCCLCWRNEESSNGVSLPLPQSASRTKTSKRNQKTRNQRIRESERERERETRQRARRQQKLRAFHLSKASQTNNFTLYIYIYIERAVELLTGPSWGFLIVIIWSKFVFSKHLLSKTL